MLKILFNNKMQCKAICFFINKKINVSSYLIYFYKNFPEIYETNFVTWIVILYLEYLPTGRLFVHEWAHLRWGVFDEYNREKPFYINGQNQVKVTRLVDLRMFKIRCYYLFIYVVLSFEGPTGGIWKFPG